MEDLEPEAAAFPAAASAIFSAAAAAAFSATAAAIPSKRENPA